MNAHNDNDREFRTGAQLLAEWHCVSREGRLERAVIALMHTLNDLHAGHQNLDLAEHVNNPNVFCGCADAYRMGAEALKRIERSTAGAGGARSEIERHHAEEWGRQIINAGGDENVAQQAVALAALNGLFDIYRSMPASNK